MTLHPNLCYPLRCNYKEDGDDITTPNTSTQPPLPARHAPPAAPTGLPDFTDWPTRTPDQRLAELKKAVTLGWQPVLLAPGKKFPPVVGFTGYQDRLVTAEVLNEWAQRGFTTSKEEEAKAAAGRPHRRTEPDGATFRQWALRMTPVLLPCEKHDGRLCARQVGLDADTYKPDCPKDWEQQLQQLLRVPSLPATYITTARPLPAGIRHYRICKDDLPSKLPGTYGGWLEIIAYYHRYAVGPGSINPDTRPRALYRLLDPAGSLTTTLPPAWEIPQLYPELTEEEIEEVLAELNVPAPDDTGGKPDKSSKPGGKKKSGHGGKRANSGRKHQGLGGYVPGYPIDTNRHGTLKSVAFALRSSYHYGEGYQRALNYLLEKVVPNIVETPADRKKNRNWTEEATDLLQAAWKEDPPERKKRRGQVDLLEMKDAYWDSRQLPGGEYIRVRDGDLYTYHPHLGQWLTEEDDPTIREFVLGLVATANLGVANTKIVRDFIAELRAGEARPLPDPTHLGLRTGDYHPDTGTQPLGDPSRWIRHRYPGDYNPDLPAGRIEEMLDYRLGPANALIWQVIHGRIFLGKSPFRTHLFLTGKKRTGKSTFAEISARLIGEANTTRLAVADLASGAKYARQDLHRAKLNLSTEADVEVGKRGRKIRLARIDIFKGIHTGDHYTYEEKWQKPRSVRTEASFIYFANNPRPWDMGNDFQADALRDRFLVLPLLDDTRPYADDPDQLDDLTAQDEIDRLTTACIDAALAHPRRLPAASPEALAATADWNAKAKKEAEATEKEEN